MNKCLLVFGLAACLLAENPFQNEAQNAPPSDKFDMNSQFFGSLSVRTDSGADSLPVYLNGQNVGVTPFNVSRLPVGQYDVSFLSYGFRDSLTTGQIKSLAQFPPEIQGIFKNQIVSEEIICRTLVEFSSQSVVIQQNDHSEALFSVEDIRNNLSVSKKGFYAKVGLVAGLIIATGLVVIFSQQ